MHPELTRIGDSLGVDPEDLVVLVEQMIGQPGDEIPDDVLAELRNILDPAGERTAARRGATSS
ncbi:hypothetical protein GCM10017691_24140 [Pseudonocardia petroleophila]|uniref:Uncharacterized protein n=1 Tax=Pseudonocardia petroleophila TaxID=37331 RepID=A0A7G7MFT1_9PSEU|nr:hypothetical protein [Pseudonocardia petroleophila]QNG51642.1 hypothetical protein H6H00_26640 [Pseudonocardia petroleophila]